MSWEDCLWQMIWNETVKVVDRRDNRASKAASPVNKATKINPDRAASNRDNMENKRRAAKTNGTTRTWTASDVLLSS